MMIPIFVGRISRFAYDPLQRVDKLLDLFFGVVRGEAGADESTAVPDAELFGERRGVEVARCDEETVLQHPRADFVRRLSLYREGYGWGFTDAIWSGVELYAGDVSECCAEGLGECGFVFFDSLHGAGEFLALRGPFAKGGDEVQGALYAGDPLVVLGARLQFVRDMVRRGVEPVDTHLPEQVAPYSRHTDVRAEELVGRAGNDVCPYGVAVYGEVRGGVHGVDGYEGTCAVDSLGDGGHVVHGADRVRGQADGYEFRTLGDSLLQVVLVEGEGFGIYPDPAHSRPLLCGGDEPGVHVGAVVELC